MSTDKHTGMRLVYYMVRFKADNESWIHQEAYTQQVCHFLNTADAEKVIKREFQNKSITEATVIKVSEEIEYTRKNFDPVIESKTTFDVEVYDKTCTTGTLRGDEYGFETLKMAQDYINDQIRSQNYLNEHTSTEQYRIIQRDTTVKKTIV